MSNDAISFRLRSPLHRLFGATSLILLANAPLLHANIYTWNTGTGTWTNTASWSPTGTPGSGDTASFGGSSPQTADFDGSTASVNGITIANTGATTIEGGTGTGTLTIGSGGVSVGSSAGPVVLGGAGSLTLVVGANQTWSNSSANTLAVSSAVSGGTGTNTLTLAGPANFAGPLTNGTGTLALAVTSGSVNLAGSNSYSGATSLNGGTLQYTGTASMSSNSVLSLSSGSTLALRSNTSGTFTPSSITLPSSGATLNFDVNNASTGSNNTLTLAGTLNFGSSTVNTINVTGGNGYTLALGAINAPSNSGSLSSNLLTLNANSANLTTGLIGLGSYGNTLTFGGTQSITANGLVLSSNGSYDVVIGNGTNSPVVTISNGTTSVFSRSTGSLAFTLNSGTFNITNSSIFSNAGSPIGATFTINGGTIDNTSGTALSAGPGMTLSGNFGYSTASGTTANDLTLAGGNVSDTSSALTVTLNGGGALTFNGALQNSTAGNQTLTVNNGLGTGTSTLFSIGGYVLSTTASTGASDTINGSGNVLVSGAITNVSSGTASSALTYGGTGTLTLSAANTYTGTTTINSGGTVQLGTSGTGGSLSTSSAIVDNGNLIFDRSNAVTQGTDFTSGAITGSGSVTQNGTGALSLTSGSNSYSGGTEINAGTLIASTGNTSATSDSALGAYTGTVTINGGTLLAGLTSSSSSIINFYNPVVLDSGVLESNDGYTHLKGPLTINGGTLSGLYDDTGNGSSRKGLWLDGAITGTANVTVAYLGGGAATYDGTMVRITSSGNAYSGTVTVNPSSNDGGTYLFLDNSQALPNATINLAGDNTGTLLQLGTSALVFGTGTTSYSINGLSGSGDVDLQQVSAGTAIALTVGGGGTVSNTVYSGALSGPGSLIKAGTSTLTLTGVNTYTGTTTISGGALQLGNGGTTGQLLSTGTIVDNGMLTIDRSNTVTQGTDFSGASITGNGGLTQAGSGRTILTASNGYSGGTSVTSGTLTLSNGSGSATGGGALTVGPGATLSGSGFSSGSGFTITGNSGTRATVLAGHTTAGDINTTGVMSLSATGASSIGSANLVFNINSNVAGQGNQLSVGKTAITFNSVGSLNTQLTLNVEGNAFIAGYTAYALITGTGTTTIGIGGVTSGQYAGLTVFTNSKGQEQIETGTSSNLQLGFSNPTQAGYYAPSYLFLVNTGGVDDIEVEVVPEPGTWAMMLGGLVLLIFWQRRKSRQQQLSVAGIRRQFRPKLP